MRPAKPQPFPGSDTKKAELPALKRVPHARELIQTESAVEAKQRPAKSHANLGKGLLHKLSLLTQPKTTTHLSRKASAEKGLRLLRKFGNPNKVILPPIQKVKKHDGATKKKINIMHV